SWRLGEAASPRLRVALRLSGLAETWGPLDSLFGSEDAHGPDALSDAEKAAIESAKSRGLEDAPPHARYGFPEFLTPAITARFGDRLGAEMDALAQRAGLDIRVNILKSD